MLKTALTELLGITYPVILAPMARHGGGNLAAAVSSAGGLGAFGATGPLVDANYVREQIRLIRSQTDRPFGVGFINQWLPEYPENFEIALAEKVPIIFLSFADPRPWLGRAKENGAVTVCQVQTVDAARVAADAGADALVAQGNEAGGHTGSLNLLPFLVRLIDEFPGIPVLAAGGIASGRSLAAVLAAGGDGVSMGTAFLATREADEVTEAVKELIVQSKAEDTLFTRSFDIMGAANSNLPPWPAGIGARVYSNKFAEEWHGRDAELQNRVQEVISSHSDALSRRDPDTVAAYFGESASFIHSIRSAAEVVTGICEEAERMLSDRAQSLIR